MNILQGKQVSELILERLKKAISKEKLSPAIAVILVGEDSASEIYVNLKEKEAKRIGIKFHLFKFSSEVSESKVIEKIKILNADNEINGIIVQVPLPKKFNTQKIINEIDVKKDVDGFHPKSIKKFQDGTHLFWPVFPKAIFELIESSNSNLFGKNAVVIVNSEKFGEVMVTALKKKSIKSEYILSNTVNDNIEKIRNSDIIITAIGRPMTISEDMIKEGVIIIDGGITKVQNKVLGDVNFKSMRFKKGFISPVPGGVGPVTIACLLENVYIACRNQNK